VAAFRRGPSPLLSSGRTEHIDRLAIRLRQFCNRVFLLEGGIAGKERARLMQELVVEDQPRIIIAIGSYIGKVSKIYA
jgi:hypothetical protein